jgi:hypothetical protein
MKFPWQTNGHTEDIRTITIAVSTEEFLRLETEAVQEQMTVQDYARAKLFAADLTPHIKQMFESTLQLKQRFGELAETLDQLADLQEDKK